MIREAIEFHFEGMELDGYPIPTPTAWVKMMEAAGHEYVAVYEQDPGHYTGYVPDFLPECEVTGDSVEEVQQNLWRAFTEYVSVKERNEEPLLEPSSWAETMEIAHPSRVSA